MTEEKNWETAGAPDELEKLRVHRNYLRGDRDGWCSLYHKADSENTRWRVASLLLVPLSLVTLWKLAFWLVTHIHFS